MKYYCTYFDKNYLPQGVALIESITKTSEAEFCFVVLCLDTTSFNVLSTLYSDSIKILTVNQLVDIFPVLKSAKKDRPKMEFFYTMTPHLIRFCFEKYTEASEVTYIDADMYFFKSFDKNIAEYSQNFDILLVKHRIEMDEEIIPEGLFNVCYNMFKRCNNAFEALNWWSQKVLESTTRGNGVFGDQKYLDHFPELFSKVGIIREEEFALAPWNIIKYYRTYKGNDSSLQVVSYHFAKLIILSRNVYIPIKRTKLSMAILHDIYLPYIKELEKILERIITIDNKYKIGYIKRNFKGLILGLFLGRAFYFFRGKLIRLGLNIPIGYK